MEIEVSEHVGPGLPAGRVRPAAPPHPGRGIRRGGVGPLAAGGARAPTTTPCSVPWPSSTPALGSREAMGLDVDAPAHLAAVRDAADAGRALEIDYLSGSRDELTTRVVEPVQVVTIDGHWYLDAYCHRAGDMRRFRVDRIGAVRPSWSASPARLSRGRGPSRRCSCRGPARSRSICSSVRAPSGCPSRCRCGPCDRDDDGMATDVVLDVSGMAWFERLLLQLGPAARVVQPAELTDLAAAGGSPGPAVVRG